MITNLKPYPATRESELEWLGPLPRHWELRRARYLFREVDQRSVDGTETHLSMSQALGLVPSNQVQRTLTSESYIGGKLCERNDLVLNRLKAHLGVFAMAMQPGVVSPDYTVLRARGTDEVSYFARVLKSLPFRSELRKRAKGIVEGFWRLYTDDFNDIYLPLPPLPEQTAIVRYLDHVDRKIRRYIRAKQKLIKLLEEQKQAIIHRAVTRGLDPDVRLKPSGVEWLGEVPEHWGVQPLTRATVERADYRGATPTKTESGVFLVTAKNIRHGWIDYDASKEYVAVDEYANIMRRGLPKCGDLLLTTEAPLGNSALVDRQDIALAQRVIRFRLDPRLFEPRFALLSVLSPYFQNQLLSRGTGSTAVGIKASKLPQLQLLCPPLAEQQTLLGYLDSKCGSMSVSIGSARQEITLLREYRTRLIADVVTGKLDVRDAAARLSDEAEEPEPLDEADELTDEEEDAAEELEEALEEAEA